ncbi:phosphotransferase system enzyme I (PtsI) [Roseimicrobium gellanilyticum]|uniref:Phosphoenolpyruvate-protein phosphotransferase n=1 Tax=Roseimicrobium gellanilyticum TaxID=748857 RepID=A0A366HFU8_9BACT|nr:phosphoenolpyruvate--protein phosphotransferase [Roseimicrobium gellanilyticum]RBP41444.1 phosphotransferase system enzyme I (PtsI) [Roseimicrobium gellanilyticum]
MSEDEDIKIPGRATSPGLARGKAFVHRNILDALSEPRAIATHQIEREFDSVDHALVSVLEDLKLSALRIEQHSGPKLAAIFGAHEAMLQDASLRSEIRSQIEDKLVGAAQALAHVFQRWEQKFRAHPKQLVQERADDIADLEGRLLRAIAGVKTTALEMMPKGRVLVAHRLLPSETVALPDLDVAGIVLEFGGPGSHAALLARALGIPTVAQIAGATTNISDEQELIVDGDSGQIVLNPSVEALKSFEERRSHIHTLRKSARQSARVVAATMNGQRVEVLANVSTRRDVAVAEETGADGIGLYRLEQYYLSRNTPPSTAELLSELNAMFSGFGSKPLTVRLLDLGADKPVSYLNFPVEDDPFLGCRGVRLLLRFPELLDAQLKALLQFGLSREVHVLVPMVTLASEMEEIRKKMCSIAEQEGIRRLPKLGAMIETPAAALGVEEIIKHADFLSIGTNDLTQYTMAAGRENPLVNDYFIEDHPAVLRLIRMVVAEAGDTPVSICGELAGHLNAIPTLVHLGVRTLSVAPPLIPDVKQAIRTISSA